MPIDTLITGKKFLGVYQDTAGTDTINLAASLSVPALSAVTLLDYAAGKWMTV